MKNLLEINVVVDTGKKQLDIYIRPLGEYFAVPNTDAGIKAALKRIKKQEVTRIIIEATGRLEWPFACAVTDAGLPLVIANPLHVHQFALSTGTLAKTDKLDAKMIAHYGEALQPRLTTIKPENTRIISDLLIRRAELLERRTMEKNRLSILPKYWQAEIKQHINYLKKVMEKIEIKSINWLRKRPSGIV